MKRFLLAAAFTFATAAAAVAAPLSSTSASAPGASALERVWPGVETTAGYSQDRRYGRPYYRNRRAMRRGPMYRNPRIRAQERTLQRQINRNRRIDRMN